jgi:outer membrane protein OmpA-like peptidoglycan-associated protein
MTTHSIGRRSFFQAKQGDHKGDQRMESARIHAVFFSLAYACTLTVIASQDVVAIDCEKAEAYYRLSREKNGGDRIYLLERTLESCPSHAHALPELFSACLDRAKVYYLEGRYEMAMGAYEKALVLKPDDAATQDALKALKEEVSSQSGEFKTAGEIVQKYKQPGSGAKIPKLMGFQEQTAPKSRLRFNNILFDEWSYEIRLPEAIKQLDEIGEAIRSLQTGRLHFRVEGHADNRGPSDDNMRISRQRSEAIKEYLVKNFAIAPERIEPLGFGSEKPLVPNDSPDNMRKNRRVEILFVP